MTPTHHPPQPGGLVFTDWAALNLQPNRMADYFTNFSFNVPLASKEQQDCALKLYLQMSSICQGNEIHADFPADLKDDCEDCSFEADADGPTNLWLHSCYGGIDAVCAFVQHLLQQFDPEEVISFEWSHDCSKPRTDAYGGGAAHITAHEIKTLNTSDWLRSLAD